MIRYDELIFSTHRASVNISDDGIINCFKYTPNQCDFAIFKNYDQAREWLITPFPTYTYRVNFE